MEHGVMGSTKLQIKTLLMGDIVLWFPKGKKEHTKKFKK